jgi:hypothetical protein
MLPSGDRDGQRATRRCEACRALQYGRTGPEHCGLIGRKVGSVPGFDSSPATKGASRVRDKKAPDRFLANPPAFVPGRTMTCAGVATRGSATHSSRRSAKRARHRRAGGPRHGDALSNADGAVRTIVKPSSGEVVQLGAGAPHCADVQE